MKSKAQVSMEYMLIIGISFVILVPGAYFFYGYSTSSNDATVRSQVTQIGTAMLTNAESIYGLAEGSMVTMDIRYPKNIRDVYILDRRELVIRYELSSGINEAVFYSRIDLSGNYTYTGAVPRAACASLPCNDSAITSNLPQQGSHQLRFESQTNYLLITQLK